MIGKAALLQLLHIMVGEWKEEANMLGVEGNSVYEIDEECIKNRTVSSRCELPNEWLPHAPANNRMTEKNETQNKK